jgi:hypothetical protein
MFACRVERSYRNQRQSGERRYAMVREPTQRADDPTFQFRPLGTLALSSVSRFGVWLDPFTRPLRGIVHTLKNRGRGKARSTSASTVRGGMALFIRQLPNGTGPLLPPGCASDRCRRACAKRSPSSASSPAAYAAPTRAKTAGAFDEILQFANIAWPVVCLEDRDHFIGNHIDGPIEAAQTLELRLL